MHRFGWLQDIRHGLRSLWLRPGVSITVISTVALAVGATTAVFSVINGVLLRPLPFPESERLVQAWQVNTGWMDSPSTQLRNFASNFPLSVPTLEDWQEADTGLEALGAYTSRSFVRRTAEGAEIVNGQAVTAGVFDVLAIDPLFGRTLQPHDDAPGAPRVVVISEGFWRSQFAGADDVLGREISLDSVAHTIVGVMPESFRVVTQASQLWAPLSEEEKGYGRDSQFLNGLGRLAPGVEIADADARLAAVQERLATEYPDEQGGIGSRLEPLIDAVVGDLRSTLWYLLGAVGLVLLIAAANIANLLSVASLTRRRELAVKAAIGAGSGRLARGLAIESAMLALLGGLAGVWLARAALPVLLTQVPSRMPRLDEVAVDGGVLLFGFGVTAATALLVGALPALQAARTEPGAMLNASIRGAAGDPVGKRVRAGLVTVEVALAVVLLVGAGLLGLSFSRLWSTDRGFSTESVLMMNVEPDPQVYPELEDRRRFVSELRRELAAIPGVEVTATNQLPLSGSTSSTSYLIERPDGEDDNPSVLISVVLENFLDVLRVPLLEGRFLEAADTADTPLVAVVNRSMAERFWPGESAVGKRIRSRADEPWATIVGVAGNIRHQGLDVEVEPMLYVSAMQNHRHPLAWVLRARGDLTGVLDRGREALAAVSPSTPVRYTQVLEERIASSVAVPRFRTLYIVGLGALAAVLALVGVFSVVALSVTQRTREIGVRIALGATRGSVVAQVVGSGVRLALGGTVLGVILAIPAARLARGFLYRVEPTDPFPYTAIALVVLAVSAAASYLPARRAAAVDPVSALADE